MPTVPALGYRAIVVALAGAASVCVTVAMAAPATAAGTSTSNPGSSATSSSVAPTGITFLTAPPASAVVGGSYAVRVSGDGATTPVQLYTQDPSVCSFAGSVVTFSEEGTCLVEAHQDADATYAEADAAQLVDVQAAPPVAAPPAAARSAAVPAVAIDRVPPTIVIKGVHAGAHYRGAGPRARCQARDSGSGVARCSLTSTRHGHVVTVRARAQDRAGNVSRRVVRYRVHTR